jgi:iron complex outermembrane recepter protein
MDSRRLLARYAIALLMLGIFPLSIARSAQAQNMSKIETISESRSTSPAKTFTKRLAQSPTIQVTGVKINRTNTGVEVVLETAQTGTLQPTATTTGTTAISTVPNAVLALPEGKEFRVENPVAGITSVTVTQSDASTIQVNVMGAVVAPVVQVVAGSPTTPTTAQNPAEPELEIVVTGTRKKGGYDVPNASVGTRTDTPIRDVPQAIQVVPQQVLKDQNASSLPDVLKNVAGVSPTVDFGRLTVRGFSGNIQRGGLSEAVPFGFNPDLTSNIDQVELIRGPASVLYGSGSPGGTVNLSEKQPQAKPGYEAGVTVGSFNSYRATLDATGPLAPSKTVLYRLNVDYKNEGSFIDFVNKTDFSIFPIVSFPLGENTKLTLDGSYQRIAGSATAAGADGLPRVGTLLPNPLGKIPRSRYLGDPDFDELNRTNWSLGYLLGHKFSEDWSISNRFRYNYAFASQKKLFPNALDADNRTLNRNAENSKETAETYTARTDLQGKFQTGSVKHDLLVGVELRRDISDEDFGAGAENFPIDIFEPRYGGVRNDSVSESTDIFGGDTLGFYAQDLLSIGDNVKVLVGGRFDRSISRRTANRLDPEFVPSESNASGFAPRVGIVYKPIEPVSLYAGWSRSFEPQFGQTRLGTSFVPITGEQLEVGVKTELFDRKLSTTLAAYQIARQNDFQPDPIDPDRFSIQVGEQQSKGIDLSVTGEPLPGLRLIAGYAYIDAKVTKDSTGLEGKLLGNVPQQSANLSAIYEIGQGDLQGFGFGGGLTFLGARQSDVNNTIELPAYTLANALLYYKRDDWKFQLNFENLFNTEYSTAVLNGAVPGAPFTVKAQVSVRF